jgi:hypothetical protein
MVHSRIYRTMWGRSLRWLTAMSLFILVSLAATALLVVPGLGAVGITLIVAVTLIGIATTLMRQIRGYEVTPRALYVLHIGWRSRVDLTGLQSVEVDPEAMHNAHMTFGGGSFGAFFRTFRNERLGHFRAFATDRDLALVLRFTGHTVVVTPADPEAMASSLRTLRFV